MWIMAEDRRSKSHVKVEIRVMAGKVYTSVAFMEMRPV